MSQNKHLSTQILLVVLTIFVVGLGFNYFYQPFWNQTNYQTQPENVTARQELPGAGNLGNSLNQPLSTKQTIAQLLVLPVFPTSTGEIPTEIKTWLETNQPGFIQLRSMRVSTESADFKPVSLATAQTLTKKLTELSRGFIWPPVLMTYFSGGLTELKGDGFVTVPTMKSLCDSPDKTEPAIASAAAQLKQLGISMVVGPVVDVVLSAGGPKGLCSDPDKLVLGSKKYIENFGAAGVLPILAHFPGSGRASSNPILQPQTLAITVSDLKPFQQLFKIYPNLGVLVSPIKVAEKFDGLPCSQSKECLATFPSQFPEVIVIVEGVNAKGARSRFVPSLAASAGAELVKVQIATQSAGGVQSASSSGQISIAESAKLSLLAGANILMFDSTISPAELTDLINQLEIWSATDAELKTAIEASWKKIISLRAGQNQ